MACDKHKRREGGKVVPVFRGLAADVHAVLRGLYNIESVKCGTVRKYHGKSKVKMDPWSWDFDEKKGRVVLYVCDKEYGECEMIIITHSPAAIMRLLKRAFGKRGISFCMSQDTKEGGGYDVEPATARRRVRTEPPSSHERGYADRI